MFKVVQWEFTESNSQVRLIFDSFSIRQHIIYRKIYDITTKMTDNFRIVEAMSIPSDIFTIYDYTKIAYITDHYLCIRQIVTPDTPPTFIRLHHSTFEQNAPKDKYIGLLAFPNLLVLAEKNNQKDVNLIFFSGQEEQQMRVQSELARKADSHQELKYSIYHSNTYIYVMVHRQPDTEIIVVNLNSRQTVVRGFVGWQMLQFAVKTVQHMQSFSALQAETHQIVQFEVIPLKGDETAKISQKARWPLPNNGGLHCWCRDQLLVSGGSNISVLIAGKQVQHIDLNKNVRMLVPLSGGFMVIFSNIMRLYRKSSSVYDFEGQYRFAEIPSSKVQLSPQEDMIAYYCHKINSICYCPNWQVSEKTSFTTDLPPHKISAAREGSVKIYNSQQSIVAVSTGSMLTLLSPGTYHDYLSMKTTVQSDVKLLANTKRLQRAATLVSGKMLNEMSQGEPIETLGIHPCRNIIAVVFRQFVRVYMVLYHDFKILKELPLSNCKQIGFSAGGGIMHAKLGGKQGSKIYLYNLNNNYECIEVLNTSRPVINIMWSSFDTVVYGVHPNGYYCWGIDSLFRQRYDSTHQFNYTLKGGAINNNSVIFWGSDHVTELDCSHNLIEQIKLSTQIDNLLVQRNQLIFTSKNGDLHHCKTINQMESVLMTQGYRLQPGCHLAQIKNNTILSVNQQGNILCLEWGTDDNAAEVVMIDRKKLVKYQSIYKEYEDDIQDVSEKLEFRLEMLRQEFSRQSREQQQQFNRELHDRQLRYLAIQEEKIRLEEQIAESMEKNQQENLTNIKDLQRIYERKLALTTNKLLTAEQMGFRNNIIAKERLFELEEKHSEGIQEVRKQYGKALEKEVQSHSGIKEQILTMKKHYETRISQLQIQNQELIKRFQNANESQIVNLKKNVVNLELKYSQAVSQKFNLEKHFESDRIMMQELKARNDYVSERLQEEIRRGEKQMKENQRMEDQLIEKDSVINCLQSRIAELQKSNEIFKYRIIEIKSISDPKEEQVLKMKDNMVELEEQYEKISKKAHEHQQLIALLKKDNLQMKNSLNNAILRQKKTDKNYSGIIDKLRQITKTPIQDIRRMLMKLLDENEKVPDVKISSGTDSYKDSALDELNRVREHLEICLKQAVDAGKKNENQKETQVKRKNKENSQLLKQINDLRIRVNQLQSKLKEKERVLQQIKRQKKFSTSLSKVHRDQSSTHVDTTNDVQRGRHTRESFFEKSLFKGHWRQKRLKTQQGTRKKSNLTNMKNQSNQLYIERGQDVEQLKRMLDQKELIIKQLINKIHKLS